MHRYVTVSTLQCIKYIRGSVFMQIQSSESSPVKFVAEC